MPRRILVTGATGGIGGLVVRQLLNESPGPEVLAGGRNSRKLERLKQLGVETVQLDYANVDSVNAALRGVDSLFLVTGYTAAMVHDSKAVLEAAKLAGTKHVVHLGGMGSSSGRFPHLNWHRDVEQYIERLGFGYTHLRPGTYMRNVLASVRPGPPVLRHFYGDARLGWVDEFDVACVAARALATPEQHASRSYELASEASTMVEVAADVATATGLAFTDQPRDPAWALDALVRGGMESSYAQSLASTLIATSRSELEADIVVDGTIDRLTGHSGTDWPHYALRHRDRFIRALEQPHGVTS